MAGVLGDDGANAAEAVLEGTCGDGENAKVLTSALLVRLLKNCLVTDTTVKVKSLEVDLIEGTKALTVAPLTEKITVNILHVFYKTICTVWSSSLV